LFSPPKVTVESPKKKATLCVYAGGFGSDDLLAILKRGVNPQGRNKDIQPILLAQAEGVTATDANIIQASDSVEKSALGADPQYTYDLNGNRITMTDPTGTTSYEYDALDRLTKITNPSGDVTTYTYDAVSRRTGMTYANGMTAGYQYDAAGRLLDLVYQLNSANVATFGYTYDKVDNRTSMTDEYGLHSYTYDTLYRLIEATHPQPVNPLEQFDYDVLGNRVYSSVYNAANQLLSDENFIYSYDKNGNTIQKVSRTDNSGVRYYWSAENQLTQIEEYSDISSNMLVSVSKYIYDGLGRRVVKDLDGLVTKYIYDQYDILLETDVSGTVKARYTHGLGVDEPISMKRDGQSYYYVADDLGSIVKLVAAGGSVVNNYKYDSFGNILEKAEGVANPYTYTAREYDAESGLYYYRARYYDAKIGRFLSEDPLRSDPNAYVYVGNNPLGYVDPMGLAMSSCVKKCIDTCLVNPFKYGLTVLGLQGLRTFLAAPGRIAKDLNMLGDIAERIKQFAVSRKLITSFGAYIYFSLKVDAITVAALTAVEGLATIGIGYAMGVAIGCDIVCTIDPCYY
jgi:RHS repeat-associated protein